MNPEKAQDAMTDTKQRHVHQDVDLSAGVASKRERRTQEQIREDHFNEHLDNLSVAAKADLIKKLRADIDAHVAETKRQAEEAAAIVESL